MSGKERDDDKKEDATRRIFVVLDADETLTDADADRPWWLDDEKRPSPAKTRRQPRLIDQPYDGRKRRRS